MPLAHAVCGRIAAGLSGTVPVEDLFGSASLGLMDAIERYDPGMGTRFETYCAVRIRGAVLDELRYLRAASRTPTSRAKAASTKRGALMLHSRTTNSNATVKHIGPCVSLSTPRSEPEDVRQIDIIEARDACDPAVLLQEKERRDLLAREVRRLRTTERLLVMLYYFDELTMKQIGQLLNVTESRVCQMHTEILERLQQRLAELDESRPRRSVLGPVRRGEPPAAEVVNA